MNRNDAMKVLELAGAGTPDDVEAAYRAKHNDLQQRILQAPVEGLKTKYREELRRVEQAREVLRQGRPANPDDLPALRPAYESGSPAPAVVATATTREQRPSSAQPRKGGSGKYIVVATLLLLAGAGFVYLTQAGPLQGWWQETLRDKDQVAEIGTMAEEVHSLEKEWRELHAELGGAEPAELARAKQLVERGEQHLSRREDIPAREAYGEARTLWNGALASAREEQSRLIFENLDRARAESVKAKAQLEALKNAERRIDDDLREATATVHSLEGRAGSDAEAIRRAKAQKSHLQEYAEQSRLLVFEGEDYSTVLGLLSRAESQLGREDGKAALSSFAEAEQDLTGLLERLADLREFLRAKDDAEREFALVRASMAPAYRPELSEAEGLLESATSSLREGDLDTAREGLRQARESWVQARENAAKAGLEKEPEEIEEQVSRRVKEAAAARSQQMSDRYAKMARQRDAEMLDRLTNDHGLSDRQRTELGKLLEKRRTASNESFRAMFGEGGEGTPDMAAIRKKIEQVREETDLEIKSLLSPEQYAAFQSDPANRQR